VLDTIFGLPIHPLVVHATVVLVPLAALLALATVFWPAARARLGVATPVLAVVALILVPLSTQSGESLEHRLPRTALLEQHTRMGDELVPWVFLLALGAVAYWWTQTRRRATSSLSAAAAPAAERTGTGPRWLAPLLAGVITVAAVGTVVQVVRIGHSGAQAAWHQVGSTTPTHGGGDD
jgi:uncharacterized membrane protein